nr:UvrD-helicase domain-containing protein [Roseomonas haemaphysalidis]
MSRPFLPVSIVELEKIAAHARTSNDKQTLNLVVYELSFRAVPRAVALLKELTEAAGPTTSVERSSPASGNEIAKSRNAERKPIPKTVIATSNKTPSHRPTHEQDQAIQLFGTGRNLKINAYAGTGKTSTLEMLSHSTKRRGQYLAFNRDIVADARKKFPNTVNCATTHSLAFRSVAARYGGNAAKLTEKINANQLVELFQLKGMRFGGSHVVKPRSLGFLIIDTVRRFTMSSDAEPLSSHVPLHGSLVAASEASKEEARDFATHGAKMLWKRMCDAGDSIPLGFDGYLKLWTMSAPAIAADFILLDEAQDTNPAVLDLLRKQKCQIVYVGDKYQQIYEWRGAVNAMDKVQTEESTYLTTSFRFGPSIAEAATKLLQRMGETRPLTGNSALASRIGATPQARTILCRTNASTMTTIISALNAGQRPHLVGGKDELMRMLEGVSELKRGEPSSVPDFFGFTRWDEVIEFVSSGDGEHLQTFVNLVQTTGERQLMWALRRTADADACDVVVSTAHRAKGREWPTVLLTDDFVKSWQKPSAKTQTEDLDEHSETRLLYVAMTRARESIEVPQPILRALGLTTGNDSPRGQSAATTRSPSAPPRPDTLPTSRSEAFASSPPSAPAATESSTRGDGFPPMRPGTSSPPSATVAPAAPKTKNLLKRLLGF